MFQCDRSSASSRRRASSELPVNQNNTRPASSRSRRTTTDPRRARQEAPLWDSDSTPSLIRSPDGEHGYKYSEYALEQAHSYDKKYRDTIGVGLPPNVALRLNEDGTQHYPVQSHSLRSANSSSSRGPNQYLPPYSQFSSESTRRPGPTTRNQCTCSPAQSSLRTPSTAERRGSCVSYSSQKSEPPSYEAAVSASMNARTDSNSAQAAANNHPASNYSCPTCGHS